jgi:thiol:disulfide interchange protein DsbD
MSGGNLLAHGYFIAFVTMFVGGFLTSLTPCVYPLIPITVSLFGARGEDVPRSRAMTLAACYVAGIGVMYASLGVGFALAGKAFGTFMANPWVIVPIAVIFVAMAASMFGAFELNLPPSLATRLSSVGGKGFGGAFAMGLVGGIIAAPCTGPTLVSALTFVATTRSVAIGGSLLFTYALGMGVLFFAIAAFAVALPKSGAWMEAVKSIFGVIMLVAALYFLRNVVPWLMHYGHPTPRFLAANAAIAVFGIGLGAIHLSFHGNAGTIVRKTLAVAMLVAGLFGVIAWMLTPKPLAWIYGEKAGMAAARAAHKPALLDFYADWCIPCKEMDVKTFDKVADELQRFQLVKVDCTNDDDPVVVETVKRYDAQTRPTVIVIDSDGKIVKKYDGVVTPDVLGPLLHSVH